MQQNSKKMSFYSKKQWMLESIHIVIFLVMIFSALYFYNILPDKIPVHWNALGEADGFGSRNSIFIFPAIYVAIYLLLLFLPTIDVYKDNVKKSFKNYFGIRISLGIFFLIMFLSIILANFYNFNLTRIIIIAISLLFTSIGYYTTDIKRNYFAGIRTPWALSDEKVWDKTHKISGKLFMYSGMVSAILGLFLEIKLVFFLTISLILLTTLYSAIYSYIVYKRYNGKIYKK